MSTRQLERDPFLAGKGRLLFLIWKGRSLFWDGKVDRFFYESRDRSILSQLFHSTIKVCSLIFYPIASIASGHPFNSPPFMSPPS
ncbi:hypothetical protein [Microcoleus sp. D2_18a_B4]|uniref:hypothetical protein n=1 Tax=Microcoleus sp. D2_18a_B4 TaxID=3055329 RepID=UPI002FD2F3A5